ncbi:MAG TPA: hypothetical protein VG818_12105 [Gemmatimonadaceae bacterium]|nr:hypothetical protein [Gemmatimonadaceae bacterium]
MRETFAHSHGDDHDDGADLHVDDGVETLDPVDDDGDGDRDDREYEDRGEWCAEDEGDEYLEEEEDNPDWYRFPEPDDEATERLESTVSELTEVDDLPLSGGEGTELFRRYIADEEE